MLIRQRDLSLRITCNPRFLAENAGLLPPIGLCRAVVSNTEHFHAERRGGRVCILAMAGPLRIEYPGAFYHVMNRGHRGEPIVRSVRGCYHYAPQLYCPPDGRGPSPCQAGRPAATENSQYLIVKMRPCSPRMNSQERRRTMGLGRVGTFVSHGKKKSGSTKPKERLDFHRRELFRSGDGIFLLDRNPQG